VKYGHLLPSEIELFAPRSEPTASRIGWLTSEVLVLVARSEDGWDALYRDPADGRYWEHTYPQSELHGGGPPRLAAVSIEYATSKYPDRTS
jgi:hypothetical protein